MKRHLVGLVLLLLVLGPPIRSTPADAQSTSELVSCSIENLTPSVSTGAWASYVVHLAGGLGRYTVTLTYGDGALDQGTYTASSASFSHIFQTPGVFGQDAHVSGAGSEADCYSTTNVS